MWRIHAEGVNIVVDAAWRLELPEGHPRIALCNFILKTLLLYPPHAIVRRLHGRNVSYVLILITRSSRDHLLKTSAWLLHPNGDQAAPAARDSSEAVRAFNRRCFPHTGNGGHSWRLIHSLSLLVGFSIQEEAMDAAQSAPHGAHYHADSFNLLS